MKLIATAVFAMFLGVVSVSVTDTPAFAADNKNDTKTQQQAAENVYTYVAQAGDSYSLMARKATQTYGLVAKVKLSLGQILFVETHLTQDAGSPMLNEGDKVSIKEADVKTWVEKAQKLSDADKTAWEAYAPYADFNTNNVGE